jgi:hypothetical protein
MVESCEDEYLKFDLEYQQVPPALSLSLSLSLTHTHTHTHTHTSILLTLTSFKHCADSGPGDQDCQGSNFRYSGNTLHTFCNV